jgi:hypothetical protein
LVAAELRVWVQHLDTLAAALAIAEPARRPASPKEPCPTPCVLVRTVGKVGLREKQVDDVGALVQHMLAGYDGLLWFRGQGCHRRKLTTSLGRRLTSTVPSHMLRVERRLITRFRQRSLPLWPEGYPQKDWEHLFAMQHYGVPTRLLDWTESLSVAAYFAADHDPRRCECGEADCKATVWILDPVQLNQRNSRLEGMNIGVATTSDQAAQAWAPGVSEEQFAPWPMALHGTHNSARIAAQRGTFTVWGKEAVPLESSNAVVQNDGILTKIVIDASHETIKKQLTLLGVRRATVYPDLGGLAHDITAEELF